MIDPIPTLHILGTQVHQIDFPQMLNQIAIWINKARYQKSSRKGSVQISSSDNLADPFLEDGSTQPSTCHQVCTVNPEFIIDARRNPAFANVLSEADLCVPDGIGVLWAAKLQGVILRERVTGSDGIYHISKQAAQAGWRLFLLGAAPGVAERAATILQQKYPGLIIAGTYAGSPSDDEWPTIYQRLSNARPDILFVAYGHPRQDFWISQHCGELPVAVAIGVGGAFDFVAGIMPRAPGWMQRFALEWLYRLIRQPWRLRRMLAIPQFIALVLYTYLFRR